MNELNFNSQVCTTMEQSQRLLELGLKPETADMAHIAFGGGGMMTRPYGWLCTTEVDINNFYPAWSLHRLLCLYGQDYTIKELYSNAEECYGMLISAIEIAIENDEFNKEYLKQ